MGGQLLNGISTSLPELLWLDRLNVSRSGEISIDGHAFTTNAIANFIASLDKLPELDEPWLRSTTQEPDGSYKFTLTMRPSTSRKLPAAESSLKAVIRIAKDDTVLRRTKSDAGELQEVILSVKTP